jgi:hypothetical protein
MPTRRTHRRSGRRAVTAWSPSRPSALDGVIPLLRIQLPAADFDYLCALADRDDTVATALAADWLRAELHRRRELDVPAEADLAPVIAFPARPTDAGVHAREA